MSGSHGIGRRNDLSSGADVKALLHVLLFVSGVFQAFAGDVCDAPVTEWKPREMLQAQLEAAGLQVRSITSENGCYRAVAVSSDGRVVALVFDPRTLSQIGDRQPAERG